MSVDEPGSAPLDTAALVDAAREVLRQKAVGRFDEPLELASGQLSYWFIDGKQGLCRAEDLELACAAIGAMMSDAGVTFDAVGGLTLGADHLAVGVALAVGSSWFIVRKETKKRGTGRRIEGAVLGPGMRILVVEDVVSTGGSLFQAIDAVSETGAEVVAAVTLVDRGDIATSVLAERGIPYLPLATYRHFDMEPVQAI